METTDTTKKQNENSEKNVEAKDNFKIPNLPANTTTSDFIEKAENNSIKEELHSEKIPYTPPDWKVIPPADNGFYVEIIKNGIIVDVIKLQNLRCESFLTVGRFPPCEIQLDHPSVSRYHCVFQFGRIRNRDCWSIYDLDSTHGSRLNKQTLKKRVYVPLRPGYVLQFAGSTRIFSFCGPVKEEQETADAPTNSAVSAKALASGDACDIDAGPSDVNKYYEKDPLGYLDKYFEREGVPMQFQYAKAEKGAVEWSCSIELPDFSENEALVAATGVTRKLAQVQCALLACQRLHGAGLLNTVSIWNKRVTYAENDYYDSDDDTYLDRTGQIEAQRAKRRKRCEGTVESSGSLTYDELVRSLAETEKKLTNAGIEIQRLMGKNSYTNTDGQVVSTITNFSSRMALSQMRAKEKRLSEECDQLRRLVALTKPRKLDDIMPIIKPVVGAKLPPPKKEEIPAADVLQLTIETSNTANSSLSRVALSAPTTTSKDDDGDENETRENVSTKLKSPHEESELKLAEVKDAKKDTAKISNKTNSESDNEDEKSAVNSKPERLYQPTAPPRSIVNDKAVIMPKYGLITKEEARIKNPTLAKRRQRCENLDNEDDLDEKKQKKTLPDYSDTKYSSEDYATWLPPQDQSGDGTTKLNRKFEGRY